MLTEEMADLRAMEERLDPSLSLRERQVACLAVLGHTNKHIGHALAIAGTRLDEEELIELARNLSKGIPFATPVFDGAHIDDIENLRFQTLAGSLLYSRSDRPVPAGFDAQAVWRRVVEHRFPLGDTGGVELVDFAVRLDPRMVLRHPPATEQAGVASVTGFRINLHR